MGDLVISGDRAGVKWRGIPLSLVIPRQPWTKLTACRPAAVSREPSGKVTTGSETYLIIMEGDLPPEPDA